jgi:hypothetical protein
MNKLPPIDPPYITLIRTAEGVHEVETLAGGEQQIVPAKPTVKPKQARKPLAQGNDRAAVFLDVPFAEKDDAKHLGAKWDSAMRKWYVPHGFDSNLFSQWWPEGLKSEMQSLGQL